jgi:hypothetical protein
MNLELDSGDRNPPGEKASAAASRSATDGTVALPEDALIILPVRRMVLFPGMILPIALGREASIAAAQAAVRKAPIDELVPAGRQGDAALEGAIGNFESVNDGALILNGKGTLAANDDRPGFEGDLEFVRRDAGKGDAKREPVRRLV